MMMKNEYVSILLIIMMLLPNSSLALMYDEINLHNIPTLTLRESMLVNIENIEYDNNAVRVIITGYDTILNDASLGRGSYLYKHDGNFMAVVAITQDKIQLLMNKGLNIIKDQPLDFHADARDASRIGEITGSSLALEQGLTGKGVKIAIVDTGTDFSNEDIRHALARDEENKPIMLDADAQGIVLTTTKFIAKIVNNMIINNTEAIHDDYTSDVYVNNDGVFLRAVRENKVKFQIYNPLYPYLSPLIFNATTNKDWKIGNNNIDFIRSASGIYRMGFIVEPQFHLGRFGLIIVPVLVIDSKQPNIYDTIIADMSDAWADFAIFELSKNSTFDFDFTDEEQRRIGDGNEMLLYDADNDNKMDLTAGVLGARVVDLWGAINKMSRFDAYTGLTNATLLQPMDVNGTYFGIMYDYFGHGTATASVIASKGINTYDIYNNGTRYNIIGVAPDAKIIPIKALWTGDIPYAWLWASGLELVNDKWQYVGKKADIINNSWGIPVFTLMKYIPGYEPISMLADILSTPASLSDDYPGVLIVSSAGNSGYGHGTVSSPGSSRLSLTVGATVNNVFVGYGFTKNEPRFGNDTFYHDDIADFSSRGPLADGYPKPEIIAPGAYGFVPMLVNVKHLGSETVSLFGGTSMAAPIVAGAAAIVMQKLQNVDPQTVKSILLSTARNINEEPFAQGNGILDLSNTLRYLNGEDGSFIVYTKERVSNINYDAYKALNFSLYNDLPTSTLYAGFIDKNATKEIKFYVHNPSKSILNLNIKGEKMELIKRIVVNGTTEVRKFDPLLNDTGGFAPNYIRLNKTDIPPNTELMVLKLRFPFETFMNTTDIYAHNLRISSLYLYEWNDVNNDNKIWFNETKMVNRGGAYGTIQHLSIHKPLDRIKGNMLIGVYPVPNIISFWSGVRNINSTSMNYTLTIDFYKYGKWGAITTNNQLIIKPNGTIQFTVNIDTKGLPYGIHQGYLTLSSSKMVSRIPVSFAIPLTIKDKDLPLVIINNASNTVFYEPNSLIGSFDMSSRFNSGEWRFYHLNVTDPTINTISARIIWENDWTSIAAFAVDPSGKIITSSVPAGVFEVFINWGSNDWLGRGMLGSGAFYPASNFGNNTSTIYIPVNGTGIYTLMLHNTLFHAKNLTEPFRIELKASTILPDMIAPLISFDIPSYVKGTITIPIMVNDPNIEEITYLIDGKENKLFDDNISLDTQNLADGLHSIEIRAKDIAGNTASKSFTFITDNEMPKIIFELNNTKPFSGIMNLRFDVIDENLANFTITLPDGVKSTNNELMFNTTKVSDGEHEIIIEAMDLAGNTSILRKNIMIDNTAPLVKIHTQRTTDLLGMIDIFYNVTDANLKSIRLFIDDKSIEINNDGRYKLDTASLADGEHDITIIAEDHAGNIARDNITIVSINQEIMRRNTYNTGIMIGIAIGAIIVAGILVPLYIKKR